MFPWRELREATGLPVLVDGAQSAGAIDGRRDAEADFYTVSAQKWLCGPDATGALYVRDPERCRRGSSRYPSAAAYDIAAATWEPKPGAARFDTGVHAAVVARRARGRARRTCRPGASSAPRELTARCRELLARRAATTS